MNWEKILKKFSGKYFGKIRILLCVCAAFGWWGILYPELAMTPDTYRVVAEDQAGQEMLTQEEWDFDSNIYWEILRADRSQVRFRSRLLDDIGALFQK